ncbi:restriction endonuclease subunit S [Uliginosibacterium sediminicola]|uniref:Restriction endonuclease subunit S n=1 Tax=Uliginosibacterium sediminicola TaxID=2024550 RepID=A0ABU9YYU7_9RHOO
MSELKPFTELLSGIVDNRGRSCPTSEQGIPLIATNCINNDSLYPTYEKARYVSQETYDTWFRGHPEPGDLIFVTKGSPGRVCMAPDPVDFCIAQDMVAVRPDSNKIYPKYLFAALRSYQVQQAIGNMHVGTLIPHFKKGDFDKLGIPVPNPAVQKIIGDMYYTISAKIDANRRMNETLEAMARAIFQSWFVDFDPVRAKASGEPAESICQRLGLTPELLALFPDSFEDSELGEIPKCWECGPLEKLLVLQRGFDLPAPERTPGDYPILAASGPSGTHHAFMVRGPGVTTGRSGVLGKVFYVHEDYWPLNTSLWVKEFKRAKPAYAFHALQGLDYKGLNAGSAVPTLNRNHAHAVRVLVPPQLVVDAFEPIAAMFLKQQRANLEQVAILAEIRDSLLPKLLSGELSIQEMVAA